MGSHDGLLNGGNDIIWFIWFKDHSDFWVEIRKGQEQGDLLGEVGGEGAGGMNQWKKMRKSDTEL